VLEQGGLINVLAYGLLAALATGLGGLLPMLLWRPGPHFLAASLGVAGGAMLSITTLGLIPMALSQRLAGAMLGLLAGLLAFAILDESLSHRYDKAIASSKDYQGVKGLDGDVALLRTAELVALAIPLHGVAEGLAIGTAISAFPRLGVVIAAALIVHKLPEGMAISTPLVALGWARRRILRITLVRGLALLAGALVGLSIAGASSLLLSVSLGMAGGAMLYISVDEMLHDAYQYGHPQLARWGMIAGMVVMMPVIFVFST
jgi:ZIP family zinc transporter